MREFYGQVIEKLQALPGVDSAAAATSLPSGWSWNWTEYTAEGQAPAAPGEMRVAVWQSVTPGFFRALRIPLLRGGFLVKTARMLRRSLSSAKAWRIGSGPTRIPWESALSSAGQKVASRGRPSLAW